MPRNKVSRATDAVRSLEGKLTIVKPPTVTIKPGESIKCVTIPRPKPYMRGHTPAHLVRWAPQISPNPGIQGGIITSPCFPPPPFGGLGGGGVILSHQAADTEPSFAMAKINFPDEFDRQPEFV